MKANFITGFVLSIFLNVSVFSQDTFSIVAVDPVTGEVGSAGASCVDLTGAGLSADFLGELFPGEGAINTQAWYESTNQNNAADRFNAGDSPDEIIDWLVENDAWGNPAARQYGIVRLIDGEPQSAGYTGESTDDYKNHVTGSNYSIQGNILLGQEVLDSMEARFLRAEGNLACKLMEALQGANIVGADSRCSGNGTSSLFAFLKVAQPDDDPENPSLLVSVVTPDGAGIEPIDSLQILFDLENECTEVNGVKEEQLKFELYPNPGTDFMTIETTFPQPSQLVVLGTDGKPLMHVEITGKKTVDLSALSSGTYFIRITNSAGSATRRFLKSN